MTKEWWACGGNSCQAYLVLWYSSVSHQLQEVSLLAVQSAAICPLAREGRLGHSLFTMTSCSTDAFLCWQYSPCQCFSRNDVIVSGRGWFGWSQWNDQVTSALQVLLSAQTLQHELTDQSQYASGYQSFSFPVIHGLEDDVFPSLQSINKFLADQPIQVLQHQQAVSS